MRIKILSSIVMLYCSSAFAQITPSMPPMGLPPIGLPTSMPLNPINQINQIDITKAQIQQTDSLQFNDIALNNLLGLIFNEVLNKNFVLTPKILEEKRSVSFRYNKKSDGNLESFLSTFLKTMGYQLTNKSGVYYVEEQAQKKPEDFEYYIYEPKFREANYLLELIRSYFGENFKANVKGVSSDMKSQSSSENPNSAMSVIDRSQDIITFRFETEKEKKKILSILEKLDREEKNVMVRAYVYEIAYTKEDGSAMGLFLNFASSKLKLNLGSQDPLNNFVSFSSNALGLMFSNMNTDTRFKLISNPTLRVKNNKQSSFNVGQSVPILGSVSYQNNGTPVQDVKYVDTGFIFQITPKIKKESIDIELTTEISEVQNTTSGLNNTPTLTKRKLNSSFTTKTNEVILLSGLTNNKNNDTNSTPFFLPFFKNKNSSINNTEIVIFFEVINVKTEDIEKICDGNCLR